jgi:malonate transporter and related proteins
MLDILAITSPIYIIILLGYLFTYVGVFAKVEMRVFGKFVLNLALPALLFKTLAQRSVGEIVNVSYLAAYLFGSLTMIGLGFLWARRVGGHDATASTFQAMGMACSNSGYVGYPILLLTAAPIAGVSLALNLSVENTVVIPLLLFMAEHSRGGAGQWRVVGRALKRLATNPLVIGLCAGLLVSATGWKLPEPLLRTADMLASSTSSIALFVIGGTLVGLPLRGLGRQVSAVVVGKLIGLPLAVYLFISILPLLGFPTIAPALRTAAVLMAAMPMIGVYPTLAQAYGKDDFCAVALLVTTIASFFSLSALLWLLQTFPF